MGDINDARREAYSRRDAAANLVGAIDNRLQAARARGDQAAVDRLEIELEAKTAEVRQAVQDALEIEAEMERQSRQRAPSPAPRKKKRWWQLG